LPQINKEKNTNTPMAKHTYIETNMHLFTKEQLRNEVEQLA